MITQRLLIRLTVLLLLACGPASAQIPPVVPGFPDQMSCTPGQLFYRQIGLDRVTNIIYHNGRIYSNNVGAGERREWLFTDPDDPASLSIVNTDNMPFMTDQGNHAHSKSGDYAGGTLGFYFRRLSPGVNDNTQQMPPADRFYPVQDSPQGGSLHRIYYPWALPFNWQQYGPSAGNGRIWRADQLLSDWQPLAQHGIAGTSILLGNLLFLVSDASMLGIAVYDIGPLFTKPNAEPQLIERFTGPVGAYIGAVWENYLVLAGGVDRKQFFVIDYSDPSNLQLITTLDLTGNTDLDAGSNVPYVQTQDHYVFTARHKINMKTLMPELELDEVGGNRPQPSVSGALDVSQYVLPLGNLLVTGSYSANGRDGVGVWCHQSQPDTRAPYVGYHIPRPGQTNYPVGAPVSLVIAETLESYTIINGQTVIVRPVGGAAVDAWTSFSHDGVLTITPKSYLQPDTTYEVIIPAGGIRDAANNGIEPYSFTFATGGSVNGGNEAPVIEQFDITGSPAAPGQSISFSGSASDAENDPLEYRFNFGDGTPSSPWSASSSINHSYAAAGHYPVKLQVRDLKPDGSTSMVTEIKTVTAAAPPPGPLPTHSSPLALDRVNRKLWVINPDNDSLTRINADTQTRESEIDLRVLLNTDQPVHPVSVTVAAGGEVWVAARDADVLLVFNATGQLQDTLATGYGSAPQAVAASADGNWVFASLAGRGSSDAGNGQLLKYSAASRLEVGRVELGPTAGALALSGDAQRVFVARFIATEHYGEIWEVDGNAMTLTRSIALWRDRGLRGLDSGGSDGPGVPNHVASVVLSPDQQWLWYSANKSDTNRGGFFQQQTDFNLPLAHDSTIRSVLGRIQLGSGQPEPGVNSVGTDRPRVDIDNSISPSALVFSPLGDYVFAALQGNDTIAVFDRFAVDDGGGRSSLWRFASGQAPQGLLWDEASQRLWVKNLLSRDLTVYEMAGFISVGQREGNAITVPTVIGERLPPNVLAGKRTFYFAGNAIDGQNEMSQEGYLSCASCHQDGAHDGRVWDFTQRGEGLRNTTSLRGRAGMMQGNVHWTANFDEIEDFVLDIVNEFGGRGFLDDQQPHPPLGTPNGGRSIELDQLADYVMSLDQQSLPKSPYRQPGGALTASAAAGEQWFLQLGCDSCHIPGNGFTDSTLVNATLHDVGTLRTSSGSRLGQPLTGIDTPTLLGLWNTAPYLHDGSAAELSEVFTSAGGAVLQLEDGVLSTDAQLPGFPDINEDSSFHGEMVSLREDGASVTLNNVDGGSGGNGEIELRYWPRSPGTLRLVVNGGFSQSFDYLDERTHFEWRRHRFTAVPLNPGAVNTLRIERVSNLNSDPGVDDITVSTADDLAQAAAHRVVGSLSAAQQQQLMDYLLQLDGRGAKGGPTLDEIFGDGFEQ